MNFTIPMIFTFVVIATKIQQQAIHKQAIISKKCCIPGGTGNAALLIICLFVQRQNGIPFRIVLVLQTPF